MDTTILRPHLLLLLLVVPLLWIWLRQRGWGSARSNLSLALRSLIVTLLVLALAGFSGMETRDRVNVIYCIDLSRSIPGEGRQAALRYVRDSLRGMHPADTAGVIAFGAEAVIDAAAQAELHWVETASEVDPDRTNLQTALQAALAALPPEGTLRVVFLTDGNENAGDVSSMVSVARTLGVEVFVVPLATAVSGNEVLLERLELPGRSPRGEPYEGRLVVRSLQPAQATLEVLRNGVPLETQALSLQPGRQSFTFQDVVEQGGLYLYEAFLYADSDSVPDNNRAQALVEVTGKTQVLWVTEDPSVPGPLPRALEAYGIEVVPARVNAMPDTLKELLPHEAILIDGAGGFGLSLAKMELIEQYVRDTGGGLVMIGGEHAFGAGGYYRTPIERVLPVSMDVTSKMDVPSLALVLVIDKSDSMSGTVEGITKLEIAKLAAFAAVEVLNPTDEVGVLAFDVRHEWIVPLTSSEDRSRIAAQLGSLRTGGGTELYDALVEAYRLLAPLGQTLRHVLVLSDGLSEDRGFETLVRRISADKITISTVAMGGDADRELMERIASWGGGRHYYTDDPTNVPRIFTSETILISRGLVVEKTLTPLQAESHQMLEGIFPPFPPLDGYVLTYPKAAADLILTTEEGDPILAAWRYGLGRSVSFTSDLGDRWGHRWATWSSYGPFVAQMVRWVARQARPESMEVAVELGNDRADVVVDLYNEDRSFANLADLTGTVIRPDKQNEVAFFEQTAPGRYAAHFNLRGEGVYFLNLHGVGEEGTFGPRTLGIPIPYSPEFATVSANLPLLEFLARETGGKVLHAGQGLREGSLLFEPGSRPERMLRQLWRGLTVAALALFLVELAVRKAPLPRTRMRRMLKRKRPRAGATPEPTLDELRRMMEQREAAARRDAQLRRLRERQGRLRDSTDPAEGRE